MLPQKKLVFTSRNEVLAERYVPVEEKTASAGSSWLPFFITSFFLLMENVTEICGKLNFKNEPYSC